MSVTDSFLEGWQTSKINDGRWQTISDKRSNLFSEKNNVWHLCHLYLYIALYY